MIAELNSSRPSLYEGNNSLFLIGRDILLQKIVGWEDAKVTSDILFSDYPTSDDKRVLPILESHEISIG